MKLKPDMIIADLVRDHPAAGKVLAGQGMMCLTCQGRSAETLRQAAHHHGLPLDRLLEALTAGLKSPS